MKIRKPLALLIAVLMISALIPCAFAADTVEILPAQVISDAETDSGLVVSQLPINDSWKDACYYVVTDDSGIAFINVMVKFPEFQEDLAKLDKDLGVTLARIVIAQNPNIVLDEVSAEEASYRLQGVNFLDSTREITLPNGAKAYVTPNPAFGHVFNIKTESYEKMIPEGICTDVKALKAQLREFVSAIVCVDEYKEMLAADGAAQADIDKVAVQIDKTVQERLLSLDLGTNTIVNVPAEDEDHFWKSEANECWRDNGNKYWENTIRDFRGKDDNSHWPPYNAPIWEHYDY